MRELRISTRRKQPLDRHTRLERKALFFILTEIHGITNRGPDDTATFVPFSCPGEHLLQVLDAKLADGLIIQVERGDNLRTVLQSLAPPNEIAFDWRWRLLARRQPTSIHVGEYLLSPPMRPAELLELLGSGRVLQHRFTVVEGWTWTQLLEALAADPVLIRTLDGYLHPAEVEAIAEAIGAPGLEHAEGWFLPETYYFVRGEKDVDILRRALEAMQEALQEAWSMRDVGLPLKSPYELLILASIVEKETSLPDERREIAGVLVRRLDRGMRLQTDPTVIYGLGDQFDGDIRRADLRSDNPYNTYTRHGLPPTPIALPGRASLMACANPAEGDALYFVANGEGGHTFSTTLAEHEAAVKKLIEKR